MKPETQPLTEHLRDLSDRATEQAHRSLTHKEGSFVMYDAHARNRDALNAVANGICKAVKSFAGLWVLFVAFGLMVTSTSTASAQVQYGGAWYTGRVCSNPNCSMCNQIEAGLRAQRSQRRQVQSDVVRHVQPRVVVRQAVREPDPPKPATSAAQAPTPQHLVDVMVDAMRMNPSDVHADLGCGDGRILITAVERAGVAESIGIEIDRDMAIRAARNVKKAVDDGRIPEGSVRILVGDVRNFNPADYGVTAITAYLYPDLLSDILPQLRSVRVVGAPYHRISNLKMQRYGDVWVWRENQQLANLW